MPDLPINIDTAFPDNPEKPDVKTHQQHHDALHALHNTLAGDTPNPGVLGIPRVEVDEYTYVGTGTPIAPDTGDLRFSPDGPGGSVPLRPVRTSAIQVDIADVNWTPTPNGDWIDLDTTGIAYARRGDVVIPNVQAGQVIEFGASFFHAAFNPAMWVDAWTIVNGAPVNKLTPSEPAAGPTFWTLYASISEFKNGSVEYKVKPADIENGNVRIRLRGIGGAQAQRIIYGTAGLLIRTWGNGPYDVRPTPQLIFDGQSFNFAPVFGKSYPVQLLDLLAGKAFGSVVGMSGTTYAQRNATVTIRTDPLYNNSGLNVVMDIGGVSDLYPTPDGAAMTAAATLAAAEAYATARKAAGADYVVGFTVTPATAFTGNTSANNQRIAYNDLLRASTVYDAIVDQAAIPELQDPTNTTYYYDGLHPTALGASLIAAEALEALEGLGVV